MSLQSWKEEFYPTKALEFYSALEPSKEEVLKAVEHSLNKWRGLLFENKEKHQVFILTGAKKLVSNDDVNNVLHKDAVYIDSSSCSLCCMYEQDCDRCVFTMRLDETCGVYYNHWQSTGDAANMVFALLQIEKKLTEDSQ